MRPGIAPIYADFDDLAESLCPLCTSAYQPGCSTVAVKSFEQTRMVDLIPGDNRGVAEVSTGLASSGYPSRFPFPALPRVAPYCVPGGVRVVSKSSAHLRSAAIPLGLGADQE